MGFLFKSKKQEKADQPHIVAVGSLAIYKYLQRVWVHRMTRHTGTFSRRTWVIVLTLFILLGTSCSVYLIVHALSGNSNTPVSISRIKKPAHVAETGEASNAEVQDAGVEYVRVRQFRLYMDSLARSPSGSIIYDSIIRSRPGLMDSVRFIETYYQQLKQKAK